MAFSKQVLDDAYASEVPPSPFSSILSCESTCIPSVLFDSIFDTKSFIRSTAFLDSVSISSSSATISVNRSLISLFLSKIGFNSLTASFSFSISEISSSSRSSIRLLSLLTILSLALSYFMSAA
jgi:hypothetical protein